MKFGARLQHEFVEFIPEELQPGTLYISIRFATATHLCCCGCGNKVVTPIRPADWLLIFDGKTISLHPSIGNWGFPCQSHYWIRNNRAEWAPKWSRKQIEHGQLRDRLAKQNYFDVLAGPQEIVPTKTKDSKPKPRWWQGYKYWRS